MTTLPSTLTLSSGCELDLLTDGSQWRGIGGVRISGTAMRDAKLPILPEIRTPEAIELRDWQIVSSTPLPDGGLAIELQPHRVAGGVMEWMLHRVHNRYCVNDWSAAPQPEPGTRLTIELRPVVRSLRGAEGRGFSYTFRYRSATLPIYKILDRATWEPGGSALGVQLWLRNGTAPSIMRFPEAAAHQSTEWWLAGCHNPSIFQFMPLQTQFPGFTMTVAEAGSLITWVDGVAHVRSLFEKPRDWTQVLHLHEHCGDLAHEFTTRPLEVLWFPGVRDVTANANLWEAMRETVYDRLHRELGMRQERIDVYGVVEEWLMPDFARYTREAVPALLACGVKQVYLPNEFANNMNTWGTGNMCCTVDWKIAESVGEAPVKAFCDAVHAGGATVHHWGNSALSTYTWLNANGPDPSAHQGRIRQLPIEGSVVEAMRASPQFFVRNMAGHLEMDHYSPVFCQINLRDPVALAYWHRCWKAAHDDVGFDGIFLDSSFNMTSDKFHWIGQVAGSGGATIDQTHLLGQSRPSSEPPKAILSQYRAHLDAMVTMQGYGYHYNGEDIGVFGSHRSGPDMTKRLDNLFMWNECLANFDPKALRAAGADPFDVFFRALAYRTMWLLYWHIPSGTVLWNYYGSNEAEDRPSTEQLAWLRAFSAVNDDMRQRTILPNESGALYDGGTRKILWAFRELTLPVSAGSRVTDLLTGSVSTATGTFSAQARHVYAIG